MKIQDLENGHFGYYDVRNQMMRFIYERSDEAFLSGMRARDAVQSIRQLEDRQSYIRNRLMASIGGLPSVHTPLFSKVTNTRQADGFRIETVIYEARPRVFVTANLYVPDNLSSPTGAVLFLCGHAEQAKLYNEYQTVCQILVRSGLVVLAIDPIGQGERLGYYEESIRGTTVRWGSNEHSYAGAQCWPLGDGLARYFLHDAMRGVDYLTTRSEVDASKIGVTGNSGGGTQTALMMMGDERIAAAAPGTFLMNRRTYMYSGGAQDPEQIWPGLTAAGIDHEDFLIAMAPRPVLVLAAKYDFFPIEGTRSTVARCNRFWEMYEKGGNLQLYEEDSLHQYTIGMARKAAAFFSLHLLGREEAMQDCAVNCFEPEQLLATKSGQILGDVADAWSIHDEIANRLTEVEKHRDMLNEEKRRAKAAEWLNDKIFENRRSGGLNPRRFMMQEQIGELSVHNAIWWSQQGIFNHAIFLKHYTYRNDRLPLTIAIWDYGTNRIQSHLRWITEMCASGRTVMILDVTGSGVLRPHPIQNNDPNDFFGITYKLAHDLMWLDDSLAAVRTYDVTRAVDLAETLEDVAHEDIRLFGHGRSGMYALLTALLDERIKHVTLEDEMNSVAEWVGSRHYNHYDISGILFPGMLQYFDLPDVRQWIGRDRISTKSKT